MKENSLHLECHHNKAHKNSTIFYLIKIKSNEA